MSVEAHADDVRWTDVMDVQVLSGLVSTAVFEEAGAAPASFSALFSDDATLQVLNKRHRGRDKPTNVLSFPSGAMPGPHERSLGDIAISYDTVAREAEEKGAPLIDHAAHMVAHGLLHLLGYDHEDDDDAEEMEAIERRALARLGIGDPYKDGEER